MTGELTVFEPLDVDAVEVLLCDADGNLFGSEEPAFEASTGITNRLLAELRIDRSFTAESLRHRAMGKSFRVTALELAAEAGVHIEPEELERWVVAEREAVSAHLGSVLRPDPAVSDPLRALARRFRLAVVTSSALPRLAACLTATALDDLLPPEIRYSAEDSLPVPTSKPDPAVYAHAGERLGVSGLAGLAVEDAVPGVRSAVAAGYPTVGNLQFVPPGEVEVRAEALREAGVAAIVPSWSALAGLLAGGQEGSSPPPVTPRTSPVT
jgi:beta-phosphoglucomutase-like phosphatase (HAD superfamily)